MKFTTAALFNLAAIGFVLHGWPLAAVISILASLSLAIYASRPCSSISNAMPSDTENPLPKCPNCSCGICPGAQIYVCEVCEKECCTQCTETTKTHQVICETCLEK